MSRPIVLGVAAIVLFTFAGCTTTKYVTATPTDDVAGRTIFMAACAKGNDESAGTVNCSCLADAALVEYGGYIKAIEARDGFKRLQTPKYFSMCSR